MPMHRQTPTPTPSPLPPQPPPATATATNPSNTVLTRAAEPKRTQHRAPHTTEPDGSRARGQPSQRAAEREGRQARGPPSAEPDCAEPESREPEGAAHGPRSGPRWLPPEPSRAGTMGERSIEVKKAQHRSA